MHVTTEVEVLWGPGSMQMDGSGRTRTDGRTFRWRFDGTHILGCR
ncbi:hypothetical protein ACFV30_01320 [Streptomyces sp. NPDC059752]